MASTSLRKLGSALLLMATGLIGFWLGGGYVPLISTTTLLAFLGLPLAVAALAPRRDSFQVRLTLLAAALLFIAAWSSGQTSANRAFDECLAQGEELRLVLRGYRLQHGRFPSSLADLAIDLPGQRVLRPSLLSYQRREGDYRLSFANSLVRHVANARYPFLLPEEPVETPGETPVFRALKP